MSSSDDTHAENLGAAAALLERCAADPEAAVALDAALLQRVLASSMRTYVRRLEEGERLSAFPPPQTGWEPTATEVMVVATQFLAACNIELFELGMWQTWGGVGPGRTIEGEIE